MEKLYRYITKRYLYKKATYYARLNLERNDKEIKDKMIMYLDMYNNLEYEGICK